VIKNGEIYPVPNHIKTHSKEYIYPQDYGGWVKQSYLNHRFKFYESKGVGFEKNLLEWRRAITNL
jgi:putative ATPase